jgi:hypothetical protein
MLRIKALAMKQALVFAVALAVSVVPSSSAWATYPGRNGRVVILGTGGWRYLHQAFDLLLIDPRTRSESDLRVCSAPERMERPPYCYQVRWPSLSPDGTKLALGVFEEPDVLLNDTATPTAAVGVSLTGGPTVRAPNSVASPFASGWAPDGTPRLLPRPTANDSRQAEALRAAGQADLSADGRLAFESGPREQPSSVNIFAGPGGGPFRQLTFRSGQAPSWSPHGRWIAFARNGGLYVVPSSGGRARRVVAPPQLRHGRVLASNGAAAWSPDGKQIAFYRQRGKALSLYSVDWKTHELRRLSGTLESDDPYDDRGVSQPLWQALPRR